MFQDLQTAVGTGLVISNNAIIDGVKGTMMEGFGGWPFSLPARTSFLSTQRRVTATVSHRHRATTDNRATATVPQPTTGPPPHHCRRCSTVCVPRPPSEKSCQFRWGHDCCDSNMECHSSPATTAGPGSIPALQAAAAAGVLVQAHRYGGKCAGDDFVRPLLALFPTLTCAVPPGAFYAPVAFPLDQRRRVT